jgi:hypothetical protein
MLFSWQDKRVLLVFADASDPRVEEQANLLLAGRDALAERDMLVLAVTGDRVTTIVGEAPPGVDAPSLRARYGVAVNASFTAVLVGKDGSVKWRESRPAEPAELFRLIDTMPMRRQEMRE